MIYTVTLNPAIDKTIVLKNFTVGGVNREIDSRVDAAGKGINVSRFLKNLGCNSKAIGFFAGNTGEFIKDELDKWNIDSECIFVKGLTRTNIKVFDEISGVTTDINERGPEVAFDHVHRLIRYLKSNLKEEDVIIVSGSVPRGIDTEIYRNIIEISKEKGAISILDADNQLLIEGLKGQPNIIKPNIHELGRLLQKDIQTHREAIECGYSLIDTGIELVVISMGAEGSIFVVADKAYMVKGLEIEAKSAVGAGDVMVGAIALGLYKEMDLEHIVRLAAAASTASVCKAGTQFCSQEEIDYYLDKIEVEVLYRGR